MMQKSRGFLSANSVFSYGQLPVPATAAEENVSI